MKIRLLLLALAVGASWSAQDPVPKAPDRPAPPPAAAATLPVIAEPWVERVPRTDLPGRLTQRDVLEGFWQLRRRSVDGEDAVVGEGHMAIGRRHIMVNFAAPGPDPDVPLLRAGTYAWERINQDGAVRMTVLVGHFNDEDGDVLVEPTGAIELRTFEIVGDALRILQTEGDWLEFVRIE